MKKYIYIASFSILGISCVPTSKISENEISTAAQFQKELIEEYSNSENSPLLPKDKANFTGLQFYPIDSKYHIKAYITLLIDEPYFEMKTSTERLPLYRKYALLTFTLEGKTFTLFAYQNKENQNYIFIPFTDLTSGESSYAGGRYLDIEIPKNSKYILLDFNKSYNPYCAYNPNYSCPIPPQENFIDYEIKAGVKKFH